MDLRYSRPSHATILFNKTWKNIQQENWLCWWAVIGLCSCYSSLPARVINVQCRVKCAATQCHECAHPKPIERALVRGTMRHQRIGMFKISIFRDFIRFWRMNFQTNQYIIFQSINSKHWYWLYYLKHYIARLYTILLLPVVCAGSMCMARRAWHWHGCCASRRCCADSRWSGCRPASTRPSVSKMQWDAVRWRETDCLKCYTCFTIIFINLLNLTSPHHEYALNFILLILSSPCSPPLRPATPVSHTSQTFPHQSHSPPHLPPHPPGCHLHSLMAG